MISDPSDEELYKMRVNLETGEGKTEVLPTDGSIKFNEPEPSPEFNVSGRNLPAVNRAPMPKKGFV